MFIKSLMLGLALVLINPTVANAGCDPCVCGPGGDYQGDIGQWFRDNCPSRGKKSVRIFLSLKDEKRDLRSVESNLQSPQE